MEGDSVEKIWKSLKKGGKEFEIKKEVKIRRKGSANIASGTQIVKGKRETYIRRREDGKKKDKKRRNICA